MTASKIATVDGAVTQPGFISFPGSATTLNWLSVPTFAVTDDLTVVARIRVNDWTPSPQASCIASKWRTGLLSWAFRVGVTGVLQFFTSVNGTSTTASVTGTGSLTAQPLDWLWVAVTFDADDGGGNRVTRFWTAPDGTTWTQLGSTNTTAGVTTIFNSSSPIDIGAIDAGLSQVFDGYISHVSIRNGIGASGVVGGTEVFRFEGEDLDVVAEAATSFVSATGHTVTVNRSVAEPKTKIHPFTYSQELVFKDKWLEDRRYWPIRDGYFEHGVAAGQNWSTLYTPDSAAFAVTDLDARWYGQIDWTTGSGPFSQWNVNGDQRRWLIEMGGGQARASLSTTGLNQFATTLVNLPFGVGQPGGIRVTRVQSTGLTRLWFSTDGVNWTVQPSGDGTVAAGTALFDSTAHIFFGGYNNAGLSGLIKGKTFYAELRNGIDGPVVYRVGPESFRGVSRIQVSSWTCETGQAVARDGGNAAVPWIYPTVDVEDLMDLYEGDIRVWPGGDGYASFPDVVGNCLAVPSRPEINEELVAGFTVVAKIRRHGGSWTSAGQIAAKFESPGNDQDSWYFQVDTASKLRLTQYYGFSSTISFPADPLPDTDDWINVAVTYIPTNGSQRENRFWISTDDRVTWTQIPSTFLGSVIAMNAGTSPLYIGSDPGMTAATDLDIAYVEIRKGYGVGGTVGGEVVFHLDRDSFEVGRRATTVPATVQVINTKSFANYGGIVTTPDPGVPPDQFIIIAELTAGVNGSGGAIKTIASHGAATPNYAWRWLWVDNSTTAKTVRVALSADGTAVTNFSVANIVPHAPGAHYYLAQSMEKVGANWTTIVYESEDGVVWTNRGTATAAFGTIFDTAADFQIGGGTSPHLADIHSFEMRTGLDPNAGTVLWKIDSDESTMPAMTYRQSSVIDLDSDGIADGWKTWQVGTVSSTKREVIDGIQYVEGVLESTTAYFGVTSPRFPVTNGTTYECSALWYLLQTAASCHFSMRVYAYNAAGAFVTEYSLTAISGGSSTYLSDVNDTFTVGIPTIVSAEVCVGIGRTFADTPGVTRAGFCGIRIGPASSYADPRGRTWSTTSAGVGNTIAYESADLTVNRSGTPSLQIYPSVIPNPARWDEAQWDDGTDWS